MHRVFRTEWYERKLERLDKTEHDRVLKFEQALKEQPYIGKPLGYEWFREKKFDGKRLLFLIYENHNVVFLITITDKKTQQAAIELIKANLDAYKDLIEDAIKKIPHIFVCLNSLEFRA